LGPKPLENPEPLSRSEPARERPPALCAIANASTSATQPLQFRLPLALPLRLPPHGQVLCDTARPLARHSGKPTDGKTRTAGLTGAAPAGQSVRTTIKLSDLSTAWWHLKLNIKNNQKNLDSIRKEVYSADASAPGGCQPPRREHEV